MTTRYDQRNGDGQMVERRSKRASHAMKGFSLALIALLVGLWSLTPHAQSVMPVPKIAFYDNNGNPCASCKLYAYIAGTTTAQNTYSDSALSTPNANPVILDSAGRATVFLNNTLNYKFTLSTAADVPIWTVDNITGQLSGIVTVTAANTRGLQITRNAAEAGLSISSVGGSGKTYGIASTTGGSLVIRDDADGTPNITINASNQIALTATGGVAITGDVSLVGNITSPVPFTNGLVAFGNPSNTTAVQIQGRSADNLSAITFNDFSASTEYARIEMVPGAILDFQSTSGAGLTFTGGPAAFGSALRLTAAITPAALAADQDNYSPTGLSTSSRVRLSTSGGARTITGLAAQSDGFVVTLVNLGPAAITLPTESASSTAANRFALGRVIDAGSFAIVIYDAISSRWFTTF